MTGRNANRNKQVVALSLARHDGLVRDLVAAVVFSIIYIHDGKRTALHSDFAIFHDNRVRPIINPIGCQTNRMRRVGPALQVFLGHNVR